MPTLTEADARTVARALRAFAHERRSFIETLGANYPDRVKRGMLADASNCDRIADELEE